MVERVKLELDRKMLAREVKSKRLLDLEIELREAAWQIGTSAPTLCRLEKGQFLPDANTLANVCHWLGKPIESFYKKTTYHGKEA